MKDYVAQQGAEAILCKHWAKGSEGIEELANKVVSLAESGAANFSPLYPDVMGLFQKIETVAKRIYHADQVIADKMVRRHPHVFGDVTAETTDEVKQHWRAAKASEKRTRESQLDGIPLAMPQLARAARITSRAAAIGYDFPDRCMLFDKLNEELSELASELFDDGQVPVVPAGVTAERVPDEPIRSADQRARVQSELGDVLFVLANIARRWGISPEEALRQSNAKFSRRFRAIESAMKEQGISMDDASLLQMEEAYQAAKKREVS